MQWKPKVSCAVAVTFVNPLNNIFSGVHVASVDGVTEVLVKHADLELMTGPRVRKLCLGWWGQSETGTY